MVPPSDDDLRRTKRALWAGERIEPSSRRLVALYEGLTPEERLSAYAELNRRAWIASGRPWPKPTPRHEWPGEVVRIKTDA